MRLCMFHPVEHPMERGWVGRIEEDHVVHLAAQTLQAFFTGGGSSREHAVYPLAGVQLLPPVLHPPAIRVFAHESSFEFRNPAAVIGPNAEIERQPDLVVDLRVAAVIGAEQEIAGFTVAADWRTEGAPPPKDRDFAFGLGPVLVTPEELDLRSRATAARLDGEERHVLLPSFDWDAARDFAADGTRLYPGDILAGPPSRYAVGDGGTSDVELEATGFDVLRQRVVTRGRE